MKVLEEEASRVSYPGGSLTGSATMKCICRFSDVWRPVCETIERLDVCARGLAALGVIGPILCLHAAALPVFATPIAYVTHNSQIGTVAVIDTRTNTLLTSVSLGETYSGASGIAASPDGRLVYALQDEILAIIDTASNTVTG